MNETPLKQVIMLTIPNDSVSKLDETAAVNKLTAAGYEVVVIHYNSNLPIPAILLLPH